MVKYHPLSLTNRTSLDYRMSLSKNVGVGKSADGHELKEPTAGTIFKPRAMYNGRSPVTARDIAMFYGVSQSAIICAMRRSERIHLVRRVSPTSPTTCDRTMKTLGFGFFVSIARSTGVPAKGHQTNGCFQRGQRWCLREPNEVRQVCPRTQSAIVARTLVNLPW